MRTVGVVVRALSSCGSRSYGKFLEKIKKRKPLITENVHPGAVYWIMAKKFMCKKCKGMYEEDGFLYTGGGYGSEWEIIPPCRRCRRDETYRRRYGVTLDEVEEKLIQQSFACGICKIKVPSMDYGYVDVAVGDRALCGVLCKRCSDCFARSQVRPEWYEQAAEYVKTTRGVAK